MNSTIPSHDIMTHASGEAIPATGSLNPYFLDLDRLLAHIESAISYYQVLNVGRDVSRDQIHSAFRDAVGMLYPPYQVGAKLPPELLARIDRAFNKLTQAFAVLASFARRRAESIHPAARRQHPPGAEAAPCLHRVGQDRVKQ